MNGETDTDIIKAKSPLLFAVLSFILKRLENAVIAAAMAGMAYWMAHSGEKQDTAWIAKHLQDKQAEIEQLKQENK